MRARVSVRAGASRRRHGLDVVHQPPRLGRCSGCGRGALPPRRTPPSVVAAARTCRPGSPFLTHRSRSRSRDRCSRTCIPTTTCNRSRNRNRWRLRRRRMSLLSSRPAQVRSNHSHSSRACPGCLRRSSLLVILQCLAVVLRLRGPETGSQETLRPPVDCKVKAPRPEIPERSARCGVANSVHVTATCLLPLSRHRSGAAAGGPAEPGGAWSQTQAESTPRARTRPAPGHWPGGFGGGRDRRRSGDLPLFRRTLYQLSYPTVDPPEGSGPDGI